MTDTITSTQVVRIVIGEKLMEQLLGPGITLNMPNAEKPTHQFQITLDPTVLKTLAAVGKKPAKKNGKVTSRSATRSPQR